MDKPKMIRNIYKSGEGILRLLPVFIPRRFSKAGQRLRLHPDDYYALGINRGSIKERWFSSTVPAINGPDAPDDEGISYVDTGDDTNCKISFNDFIIELGAEIIGPGLMERYGTWPMFAKFFDYNEPLFHHLHPNDKAAARIGMMGKPEAYYYPPQLNNHLGTAPYTYFGFAPDVTIEEVREKLLNFKNYDTRITELSRAFRLKLGTGWYTPPGVVHAPGSLLTYEPQWNSDVNAVFENITAGEANSYEFLVGNCPDDEKDNIDYVLGLMDWEKNIDPHYRKKYFRAPVVCASDDKHIEKWIVYANDYFGAKELTVLPGQTVTVKDEATYGCILIQGHGRFGTHEAEAATMLRFGQKTADEYFVSEEAAQKGVTIVNNSKWEPLVVLKHFANNHPKMPQAVQ